MSERESIDHVWAGLLNGTVITAIGAAFPLFFLWHLITQGVDVINYVLAIPAMSVAEFMQGCSLLVFSYLLVRSGCRLLTENIRALRAR